MGLAAGKLLLNKYVQMIQFDNCRFIIQYWGGFADHHDTNYHQHSFWEMCFVISGTGIYAEKDEQFLLKPNTLFLSKPNIAHKIESLEGIYLLYVAFDEDRGNSDKEWRDYLNALFLCQPVVYLKNQDSTAQLWKILYDTAQQNRQPFLIEKLQNLAKSLLQFSFENFAPIEVEPLDANKLSSDTNKNLTNVIKQYILDNLASELKLADVAKNFYISTRQLSRIFLTYEEISFSEYKKRVRLKQAADDIKNTTLSFSHIAEKNGFATLQYFSKCFTEYMNETPTAFRKIYLDKNKMNYSSKKRKS